MPSPSFRINLLNLFMLCLGGLINTLSYFSLAPVIVVFIFYCGTYILLVLTPLGGVAEQRMFSRVFSLGFLVSGVAAVYANQLSNFNQLYSDANHFFDLASRETSDLSFDEIQGYFENALPIVIWRAIYDFFAALGFAKGRYIGVTFNMTAVALSGVIGIKIVRQIFGDDEYRFHRFTLLVASCGLFWLFASIHLRDALVLLAVTALIYKWSCLVTNPSFGWGVSVTLWSLLSFSFFGFLRAEFVFVPIAIAIAAFPALLSGNLRLLRRPLVLGVVMISGIVAILLVLFFSADITLALERGSTGYDEKSAEESGTDSLGMALVIDQPLLVRLLLGSIYLFAFPVPFWSGFQLESAYHLFKSANVIFFYFILPLLMIALNQLIGQKKIRTPTLQFMVFLSVGFTLAIAASSLENRHFGVFLIPIFILATIPDLRVQYFWQRYKAYLSLVLAGVSIVHLAWVVLKL